jgi:bifunctional ADP-heptose synthase (sugar kinase/adenylyltransferase)
VFDSGYLVDLVKILEPRVLVLGREFERDRATEVAEAIASVRIVGGKIIYATGEVRFASTNLFAARQDELELEKWRSFEKSLTAKGIELDDLSSRLIKGNSSNLLIIGDTIVDQYIACDPVGMSAEAPVVVVKELDRRDFIGGAAIVSAHAAALGANSKYLSVTGEDPEADMVYGKLVEAGVTERYLLFAPKAAA